MLTMLEKRRELSCNTDRNSKPKTTEKIKIPTLRPNKKCAKFNTIQLYAVKR